jgi:DNA-binding NarL/FixJ family response regulator
VYPHAQIQESSVFVRRKVRCVLAHDHVLLRQGLRRLLEDEPDLEVVGEAGSAKEALQRVFESRPDVLLADARTFEVSSSDAKHWLARESPQTKILFLSMEEGEEPAYDGLRADAAGRAVRQTSAEELMGMVRRVSGSLSRDASAKTTQDWRQRATTLFPKKRALTGREREVIKLLAEGRTVRAAASILGVSAKTVDAHKFNLMRKLGIHNKAELVMWAIQKKVVKMPVS